MARDKLQRWAWGFALCLVLVSSPATAQLVADAGDDLDIACSAQGGAEVTLDGTGSSTGADVTYQWTAPGIFFSEPGSLTPTAFFPVDSTEVTLTVTRDDGVNDPETVEDTVVITVFDDTPPVIQVTADPDELWPPNHKFHAIHVDVAVDDECDPGETIEVVLLSLSSSEDDNGQGDGNSNGDIRGDDIGTDDRSFELRAERAGGGTGRVYTATYRATDASGNQSDAVAVVDVPHDQGHKSSVGLSETAEAALARAEAAEAAYLRAKEALEEAKAEVKALKKAFKDAQREAKAAQKAADAAR